MATAPDPTQGGVTQQNMQTIFNLPTIKSNIHATMCGWTLIQTVYHAASALQGEALEWYAGLEQLVKFKNFHELSDGL